MELITLTLYEAQKFEKLKRVFESYEDFNFFGLAITLEKIKKEPWTQENQWVGTLFNQELIGKIQALHSNNEMRRFEQMFYQGYKIENCPKCNKKQYLDDISCLCDLDID